MNMKKKSIILGILAVTVVASLGIFKAINSSNDKSITKADEVEISSNSQQSSSSSDTTAESTEGEGEGERDGVYNGGEGASIPIRFEEAIAEDGTTVLFPVLDTEADNDTVESNKDEGKGTSTVESKPESKPESTKPKPETPKPKPETKPESPKPSKPTPPANSSSVFTEEELRELDEILGLTDPTFDYTDDGSAGYGVTGNSFLD